MHTHAIIIIANNKIEINHNILFSLFFLPEDEYVIDG